MRYIRYIGYIGYKIQRYIIHSLLKFPFDTMKSPIMNRIDIPSMFLSMKTLLILDINKEMSIIPDKAKKCVVRAV